ncbi:MAG: BNR-4 repeat-containing protein [Akkermansiaceae bacterium]|nr:BNR-4 repeat-containing protein [Akkermansiaceae bacterium]
METPSARSSSASRTAACCVSIRSRAALRFPFDLSTLTGTHAFAANEWFHVAVTYDASGGAGTETVKFYWTRVDSGSPAANLVHTSAPGAVAFNSALAAPLVLGNEGRADAMGETLVGLIDEGRVSDIARTADDFLFSRVVTVAGSTGAWEPANPPANTLDGDLGTRASAAGDGSSITYHLGGGTVVVPSVRIAFFNGNSRSYLFDILVSEDNVNWSPALTGATSSGTSLDLETFDLPTDPSAAYLRIVCHGYNGDVNAFNSYTEVVIDFAGDPNADTDSDGLPDGWENDNFGSLALNAYDDPDADGALNIEELTAATSPVDPEEHPLWESPRVALEQDSTVTTNARLFASGATYGRAINGISYQESVLQTFGGYQYTAWYDNTTLTVFLARRTVSGTSTGSWEIVNTGSTFVNGVNGDAHNVVSFGICETDGTLHMAWDHHGHDLRYRRSVAGLCTTNTGAWGPGMMNTEQDWLVSPAQPVGIVTYPGFVSAPDGRLVFQWRYGSSGSGDNMLSVYDGTSGTWSTPVQFDTRTGTYVEGSFTSTSRNSYLNGIDFTPSGDMHITWTWREGAGTSNHDICHAYSSDLGVTWRNGAGSLIANTGLGQRISLTSPGTLVKRKDLNQLLINQQAQCVDEDGRLHVLMLHRREDPGFNYPNITNAAYSINGTAYYHYFRDPVTGDWAQRRIPPEIAPVGSRASIGYDADGNLYAAFLTYTNRGQLFPGYRGGHLAIATASKASSYTNWEVVSLSSAKYNGEPLLDQSRLLAENILSIFIQEDSTSTSAVGTPLHIIDFSVEPVADADTDNDGLLDSWERTHFGDLSMGNVDSDGDGASNAAERIARTDPDGPAWRPTRSRLLHRWSFNGTLTDSAGGSDAGIVEVGGNNATLGTNSVTLAGGDKAASDYVLLGNNLIGGRTTPVTIELWATQNQVRVWSRIFDFHQDTDENLFMSWSIAADPNNDRVAWKQAPDPETAAPNGSNAPYTTGTPYHIVMTITPFSDDIANGSRVTVYSAPAGSASLGAARASFDTPFHLAHLNDALDTLGRSPWPDETASASYDEVRIWEGALTPAELELFHDDGPDLLRDPDDLDSDGLRDAWETDTFGATETQNATDDSDHDGTDNLTEQRLGLLGKDGSSRFAANLDGFALSWPGAYGSTFLIQRSTGLTGWQTLATRAGHDGTNIYTDPEPPEGKAFYRVLLTPQGN